jgi:hypothetical protein
MSQKVRHAEFREKTQELLQGMLMHGRHGGQIIASLTRRTFLRTSLTTSAVGAGVGLLAATGVARDALAQSGGGCAIRSNFNGTAIAAGDWIWFTSVLNVHGLGSQRVTIGFTGSIEFSVDGTMYMVQVPSALVTFLPDVDVPVATTTYCNGQWATIVPLSGLAGNVFLDGFALQAPVSTGFPGGIQPVTWQGMFFSLTQGITIQWQWGAAVYTNNSQAAYAAFNGNYNELDVKPVDDNTASAYQNSDHAGTPENFKPCVVGGATGGGGSNFTGSFSGTAACTPTPAQLMSACGSY